MCCYVIVTVRSMLWSLLSITACLTELAAFMSAHWLITSEMKIPDSNSTHVNGLSSETTMIRTIGLFLRCQQVGNDDFIRMSDNCRVYAHSIGEIASPFWTATCIFMATAILFLLVVALFSVWALCFRNLGRKSIFSISGILQAIAGLLLIFSLVLFPAGWGSERVQFDCGAHTGAFNLGTCHIGWAYYAAMFGTLLSFFCAVMSNQAEASTGSERVENDIIDGKNPVCAL
uniref:LHFPL tetraspan subfamily member 2a protein-like n=1 Tax=Ciona intestinalis TaxID=7719 RepID=F6Y1B6_CIOIN|nr:LHFPL tetraspan subfamily member 2a protein-like [Ciona intestinalis]|eukprot:XP_002128127.1 LHFPL tetraspan subfamily member 2a protein-like [Ciona intestinalis]